MKSVVRFLAGALASLGILGWRGETVDYDQMLILLALCVIIVFMAELKK